VCGVHHPDVKGCFVVLTTEVPRDRTPTLTIRRTPCQRRLIRTTESHFADWGTLEISVDGRTRRRLFARRHGPPMTQSPSDHPTQGHHTRVANGSLHIRPVAPHRHGQGDRRQPVRTGFRPAQGRAGALSPRIVPSTARVVEPDRRRFVQPHDGLGARVSCNRTGETRYPAQQHRTRPGRPPLLRVEHADVMKQAGLGPSDSMQRLNRHQLPSPLPSWPGHVSVAVAAQEQCDSGEDNAFRPVST